MSTTTINPYPARRPSPLRETEALLARMRGARLQHGDCGGQLEVEVLHETTADLRDELQGCTGEARLVHEGAGALGSRLRQALAPRSPGGCTITRAEAAALRRQSARLNATARHHTHHLTSLLE